MITDKNVYIDLWEGCSQKIIIQQSESLGRRLYFYITSKEQILDIMDSLVYFCFKDIFSNTIKKICTITEGVKGICYIDIPFIMSYNSTKSDCYLEINKSGNIVISPKIEITISNFYAIDPPSYWNRQGYDWTIFESTFPTWDSFEDTIQTWEQLEGYNW